MWTRIMVVRFISIFFFVHLRILTLELSYKLNITLSKIPDQNFKFHSLKSINNNRLQTFLSAWNYTKTAKWSIRTRFSPILYLVILMHMQQIKKKEKKKAQTRGTVIYIVRFDPFSLRFESLFNDNDNAHARISIISK